MSLEILPISSWVKTDILNFLQAWTYASKDQEKFHFGLAPGISKEEVKETSSVGPKRTNRIELSFHLISFSEAFCLNYTPLGVFLTLHMHIDDSISISNLFLWLVFRFFLPLLNWKYAWSSLPSVLAISWRWTVPQIFLCIPLCTIPSVDCYQWRNSSFRQIFVCLFEQAVWYLSRSNVSFFVAA